MGIEIAKNKLRNHRYTSTLDANDLFNYDHMIQRWQDNLVLIHKTILIDGNTFAYTGMDPGIKFLNNRITHRWVLQFFPLPGLCSL
jgi:hypothetical protein